MKLIVIFSGMASFAQERIFLDEKVRFSNKVAVYNELIILQPIEHSLSVDRLLQALRYVIEKHQVLRTSLIFNNNDNTLKQCITNQHQTFTFMNEQTFENYEELNHIIYQIRINPNLFDLSIGRVFFSQIFRHKQSFNQNNNQLIKNSDIFLVGFHHTVYDGSSLPIFLKHLCFAYNNYKLWSDEEQSLQYIDYSVYERLIDMTSSRQFWHSQLEGYNAERSLSLPIDRRRSFTDQRSGLASVGQISFDKKISTSFLKYASSHQLTPFQLGLATFYVFLFKLTHGQTDLCIASVNANRYRNELQNMIGMFVSTLPYRLQLDSYWSFDELVKYVQEKCLSILEHSHYPLQHILTDFHLNQSNVPFLETMFDFITVSSSTNRLLLEKTTVEQVSLRQIWEVAKFDFSMAFVYNSTSEDDMLSCSFVCSHDLFDETSVAQMARRFQHVFEEIFATKSSVVKMDYSIVSINQLSLILPEEVEEMQTVVFCRPENIIIEGR